MDDSTKPSMCRDLDNWGQRKTECKLENIPFVRAEEAAAENLLSLGSLFSVGGV